ncbi:MAG: GspE/PulE family protein [Gemmataceae bacterium]|nr:GspE/PulE family protein [Gemmataceae bacterium]
MLPLPDLLFATVPRGPGFYFSPVKLVLFAVVYLCWVRTSWWVGTDARQHGLPVEKWALSAIVCGAVGLVLVFSLPVFWAGLAALAALWLTPSLLYARARNKVVDDDDKVLTAAHFRRVLDRLMGARGGARGASGKKLPVRFIGKGKAGQDDDDVRVKRAAESEGYREAVEMVYEAIQARATDIHMEPTDDEMIIRYRVDGMLTPAKNLDRGVGDKVLNVFKVLAAMDITEKRKSQDGGFSAEVQAEEDELAAKKKRKRKKKQDEEEEDDEPVEMADEPARKEVKRFDFRVATAGSVAGEKLVMRLLDRSRQVKDLDVLGMKPKLQDQIKRLVTQPHGMFLVCGPTGSGKSTTLCACLFQLDRHQKNVITVEDPVEYHIEHVTQIEVNPKAGKTFASELRSILRQDPDVIYIGEVRDEETAEIACKAAQTGHMVFSTVHSNDAVGAINRLLEYVKPFQLASALGGILSQRLVRTLCPRCKVAYRPPAAALKMANIPAEKVKAFFRPPKPEERPEPCKHCGGTGYRGRTGVFELLVVNERLRELIKEDFNAEALRQEALKNGMVLLAHDGLRVVIEGRTSIDEIQRVAK